MQCPQRPEKGNGFPHDLRKLACVHWELDVGPLGEQPMLLAAELSPELMFLCLGDKHLTEPYSLPQIFILFNG